MTGIISFSYCWKWCMVLAILLLPGSVFGDSQECNETLPGGCSCVPTELSLVCADNKTIVEFPSTIPSFVHMHFENLSIEVIDAVPYDNQVRKLAVIRCGTRLVRDRAFGNLINLETLNLGYNEITSLRSTTFIGLKKLTNLVLSHNPLFQLKAGTFVGSVLPQLEFLYLSNCELYNVEYLAIDKLSNLDILSMTQNHLREMPELGCTGDSLTNLRTWDLSYNEINHIPRSDCKMPAFQDLYLTHNGIEMLNASFLGNSGKSLRQLHLNYNWLSYVHPMALKDLVNLTVLDVSNNWLTVMDVDAILWNHTETVLIHDNPWNCSCVNHWLVDEVPVAKYNSDVAVRCGSPDKLFNISVTKVDQHVFTDPCNKKTSHSPGRVTGIVMGVLFGLVGLFACTVICYRMATRKPSRALSGQNNTGNQKSTAQGMSPRRSASGGPQSYARMQDDPTFEFEGETPAPAWDNSQMPSWETEPPLNNQHTNFKL